MSDLSITEKFVQLFNELSEQGIYFECGTLVFNSRPDECRGLQIVVNHYDK